MLKKANGIASFVLIILLSAACLMPVMAEEQQNTVENEAEYSDEKLRLFIVANIGIYQLQQRMTTEIENFETDEQRLELIQATNQQMEGVLQKAGFTIDDYNAMGKAIQSDPQLQEKINAIAEELSQQQQQ